ncbi:lysylphosphatidylglycerol synthase transmembrane domain-containing protein [Bifidobacterium sp.]|jgi:uncharacterized protein (TIRG00374 family)|uniref:lysylphosphatidylglycerol synthase transmembrane domain-containing protein n=1 Tax=Bifidobacterium sp. TaxID=41200 RepID=UPI0025C5D111|nr:lysylphosphatidylglycerol synthase transmembrane domain-containing protein [Bifidobacterium sp.]MCH4208675.1 flippase-like domain-containing protein [Bifidobacterium sp.]MCI1224353.1 flippase-like domain-containing protein [Bifidobacterium sp.]
MSNSQTPGPPSAQAPDAAARPAPGGEPSTRSQHPQVHIEDEAPERTRDFADLLHAALALLIAVAVVFMALYLRGFTTGVESDARTAGQAFGWLMDMPATMLQQLATFGIIISVLIHMLVSREWLQSSIAVIALFAGYIAIRLLSLALSGFGGVSMVTAFDSTGVGPGSGLLPDIYAGIAAFLTVAGPRRTRSSVKWGWNVLYAVAVVLVVVSWHSVSGILVSFAMGRLIGMLLRFAVGTQNKGEWGEQIVQSLRSIGLNVTSLSRRQERNTNVGGVLQAALDDDLIENSRIYDARDDSGDHYIVSVLDAQTHTAGYLNQLWQWLRLTGVSMRRDRSATDANHHHLAMILGLGHLGLRAPVPYGVTDSEESSLLVFEAKDIASPLDLSTLGDEDAESLMRYLKAANARGYTHRRITPESIARMGDGEPIIAGWHNGDCASGSANVALDKVQLLNLLGATIGVERTVSIAQRIWGRDTLIRLAPFVQKVAVPYATRALTGWHKQLMGDLRAALDALAPTDANEYMGNATLSRFSVRSFIAIVLAIVAVAVIFTQLQPDEVVAAVTKAKLSQAVLCFVFGMVAWAGAALSLGAFMDKGRRHYFALFCSQAASGFTAVSMPAGVGPAFVNLQHLRKSGYRNTVATAIMSATWLIQAITTVLLLLGIGIFTGRNTLSGMIPTNTLIVVIGVLGLLVSIAMVIPPLRRLVTTKYLPVVKAYAVQLIDVMSQPAKMFGSVVGSLVLNISTGLGFWSAMLAFGYHVNPVETIFIFLLANTLGSAIPTPGGLGAVEAALTFAFTSVGVPAAVALSATLLYRVCFYWLRIPIGALAMKWLDRHNLI